MKNKKKDNCNICNKPFIKDEHGNWTNHKHKLAIK